MMKFINYLVLCIEIGITQFFLIPSIVEDILEQKNKLPNSNIFSASIQVLVEKRQEAISSDAGWIERFLLATILTFITLPLIFLTLIIAPIAHLMNTLYKVMMPTQEETTPTQEETIPTQEEKKLAATLTEVRSNLRNKTETKGILKKEAVKAALLRNSPQELEKNTNNPVTKKRVTFEENSKGKRPTGDSL